MVVFPEAGGPNITTFGTVEEKDLAVSAGRDKAASPVSAGRDKAASPVSAALGLFLSSPDFISASDTVIHNPEAGRRSRPRTHSLCLER